MRLRVVLLALVSVVLAGCGGGEAPARDAAAGTGEGLAVHQLRQDGPGSAGPTAAPEEQTGAAATPTLPPGDPGLAAPSVPDPGTAGADPHAHEAIRRTVPLTAMLGADDVSMLAGPGWQRRAHGGDECVRLDGAVATRSMAYGGAEAGIVVETVGTYTGGQDADAAVRALATAAAGCGWEAVHDPRLGSASVAASDGPRSLVAVAAEGVVVLLVGAGEVTRVGAWSSLVDLALGSSCPAAPDGCH